MASLFRNIIAVLLLFMLFKASLCAQNDPGKKLVDFSLYKKELIESLNQLSEQHKISIAYAKGDIPPKLVSINVKKTSVHDILEYLLKDTGLIFENLEHNIVVYRKALHQKDFYTINGKVLDSESGEILPFADIYLEDLSTGTSSNEYGYFSLKVARGKVNLVCSYLNYGKYRQEFKIKTNIQMDIFLNREESNLIEEVLITANKKLKESIDFFRPNLVDLDQMDQMVSLGGEDDIIRLMYTTPGVLSGSDGFGGMHVRGGNSGHNQVLLDGVPIYNAEHAIGLFSIFNSNVIQSTQMLKGDFPARYGGNLASVLDIRTRNGDKRKVRGMVDLGLFTLKAGVEGPIVKNKASFLISARRTYADIWLRSLRQFLNEREGSTGETNYFNYDLNAKLHFKLSDKSDLVLNMYRGRDKYDNDYSTENELNQQSGIVAKDFSQNLANWGNSLFSLKYTTSFNSVLFYKSTLSYNDFRMDNFVMEWDGTSESDQLISINLSESLFVSEITDVALQNDLEYHHSPEQLWRFGIKNTLHLYNPLVNIIDQLQVDQLSSYDDIPEFDELKSGTDPFMLFALENRAYIENQKELPDGFRFNAGLHLGHFYYDGKNHFSLEPRLLANMQIGSNTFLSGSATIMSQFHHQVDTREIGFPARVILPSYGIIRPQRSWQLTLGLEHDFGKGFVYSFQSYFKEMNNQLFNDQVNMLEISAEKDWDLLINRGIGYAYGTENELLINLGKSKAKINHTLLFAKRKFADINNGLAFDHRFARRHTINLNWNHRIGKNVDFSLSWVYGTGNPYTFPTQIASFIVNGVTVNKFIYDELNNSYLPDYHRLDLEFNIYNKFSWGQQKFTLGVYNAYNRKNPFYVNYDAPPGTQDQFSVNNFEYVYVFPLMPVLSYSINF